MNVINYDKEMQNIIERLGEKTPRLLLHSCCGPCSSYCLEELDPYFLLTVFYYNPNIDTEEEYVKRQNEQKRFIAEHPWKHPVDLVENEYDKASFGEIAKGREMIPEGGERCFACYRLRLEKTARYAKEHGYDYFATTLTVSPLKNADVLNKIGMELGSRYGVAFLPTDFKKRNGYVKSVEISKKYDMYRQDYCGCVYSKEERKNKQ